jgi:hypothetical protein
MDPVAYNSAYTWVTGMIDLTWLAWIIIGPLFFMRLILKFLGWSRRQSRGANFDDLSDQVEEGYHTGLMGRADRLRSATRRWRK